MKAHSLDQVQDELIGKIGTPERDRFEYELQMDISDKDEKEEASRPNPADAARC